MGRELRRVRLDFDWPLDVVWKGFCNPYRGTPCRPCDGSGYSPEAKRLGDDWYDLEGTGRRWSDRITQDETDALVAASRLHDLTHRWTDGRWVATGHHPTADEVNAWARGPGFGHDAINRWICVEARCARLGYPVECALCRGDGELWCSPKFKRLRDAWRPTPPPRGRGFQLWSTTTEGHPMTPVFRTLDALCAHAAAHVTTFGEAKTSAAEWARMLGAGLVVHREDGHVFL